MNLLASIKRIFGVYLAWRRRKDERAWETFEAARTAATRPGMRFGQVRTIRQNARTGTKAYVLWFQESRKSAVWLPGGRFRRHEFVLLTGSEGYGSHHGEEVFYITSVDRRVAPKIYRAWRRHEARRTATRDPARQQ